MSVIGPQPQTRAERMATVHEILRRVHAAYGAQVRAVGLYGSTARGDDQAFSDIEMLCILSGAGLDFNCEWCAGPWKAEVNFRSRDVLERRVSTVESDWPLTHGKYRDMRPLYDPDDLFGHVRRLVFAPPPEAFIKAIEENVVGEQYELIGKLRNAVDAGEPAYIPTIAVELARHGACAVGLAARQTFSTAAKMLQESRGLPSRPRGFDELCERVMRGDLSDPQAVAAACE
ncbi:MAG TPA: kanamycin nucleotidyltransferase C-terminal domain-containing protein, partial [Limnochordia bacterium]